MSEEFRVKVGLRQSSALNPLLFIAVEEVISRKTSTREILRKLLYADDLAVVADSEADLLERLVEWKEIFLVGVEGNIWQAWIESKSGGDGGVWVGQQNSWGNCIEKAEGEMGDRRKLKGKVHRSCVSSAYLCGLETMTTTVE